jgi:hypothetical protein
VALRLDIDEYPGMAEAELTFGWAVRDLSPLSLSLSLSLFVLANGQDPSPIVGRGMPL